MCNVEYVRGGKSRHETMDISFASKTSSIQRGAVIFIHGGGWEAGDKTDIAQPSFNVPAMAVRAGWVAFNMNYRLATPASSGPASSGAKGAPTAVVAPRGSKGDTIRPWVDQPADVIAAVRWVKSHAKTYRIDPARVALVGASAGGHLALLVGMSGAGEAGRIAAVVSWAGPTDLALLAAEHGCGQVSDTCGATEDPPVGRMVRSFVGGCTLAQCPDRYNLSSPVLHVGAASAPALFIHATFDTTVPSEQTHELETRLKQYGVPYEDKGCVVVDANGIPFPCNHFTMATSVWNPTRDFLGRHL